MSNQQSTHTVWQRARVALAQQRARRTSLFWERSFCIFAVLLPLCYTLIHFLLINLPVGLLALNLSYLLMSLQLVLLAALPGIAVIVLWTGLAYYHEVIRYELNFSWVELPRALLCGLGALWDGLCFVLTAPFRRIHWMPNFFNSSPLNIGMNWMKASIRSYIWQADDQENESELCSDYSPDMNSSSTTKTL